MDYEIAGPLSMYHPKAVLHCLLTRNGKHVVAYMQHLMAHPNILDDLSIIYKNYDGHATPFLSILQMQLSKFCNQGFPKEAMMENYNGVLEQIECKVSILLV